MNTIAMTLRLEPEMKTAVEAVGKLLDVERAEMAYLEDWRLRDGTPDWSWVENHKPLRISVNGLIVRFVLDGLCGWHESIQKEHPKALKRKEGLQQILNFLFDHPEIEHPTTEHFTQEDPAYEILETNRQRLEQNADHLCVTLPIDRSIAAHWLANEEVLLQTAAETLAAIEPALVPPHKRPNANVRKTREEDEQELIEGDDKPQAAD